jgi:hypothetical protein
MKAEYKNKNTGEILRAVRIFKNSVDGKILSGVVFASSGYYP